MIDLAPRVRALAGRATTLVSYGHPAGENRTAYGVAVLDRDELVLFQSPGARPWHELEEFAADHGLGVEFRRYGTAAEARVALARRASGWHGLPPTGPPAPRESPRLHPVEVANELRYLEMIARTWRDMRAGRAHARLNRPRRSGGRELARLDGRACRLLSGRGRTELESEDGPRPVPEADLLLCYATEPDIRGLIVFGTPGRPVVHLPGRWDPEDARRFAERNVLGFEARGVPYEEYVTLTGRVRDAVP
ncbi:hypothetical protein ACLQ2R_03550 [Streptosporangium sp. DT93]|uniref:hypothetical protein n=1 Tax=Streptosporangium sp. DT93 TaxID=3393428 RepID=UPI003CF4DA10